MNEKSNLSFEDGYACAVVNLINMFDQPSMAKELLNALGNINYKNLPEHELNTLVKHNLINREKRREYEPSKCHTSEFHCSFPECACGR